ncbi:hypothetical protein [Actinophytocola sp.]|uniref:hypothetical protein n=1 Tax=Actinophytocola sp. TaxID=1872138 RepID=UPI002ED6799D
MPGSTGHWSGSTADRLTEEALLAGPVRLRHAPVAPDRLRRLAEAFDDAIVLFGLGEHAGNPPRPTVMPERGRHATPPAPDSGSDH